MPKSTFVIGYDTFIRLIDLKYYENNNNLMNTGFEYIKKQECNFIVAGRLNTNTDKFMELDDEAIKLIPL
jgi:hypothetical protein